MTFNMNGYGKNMFTTTSMDGWICSNDDIANLKHDADKAYDNEEWDWFKERSDLELLFLWIQCTSNLDFPWNDEVQDELEYRKFFDQ